MDSLELEDDMKIYRPKNPVNFGTWVRLSIGPEEESGADSFDLLVCTPDWLKNDPRKFVWGRHMLIVFEYDLNFIRVGINQHIETCFGNDWNEVAQKLSRIYAWEFEDYRPSINKI